MFHATHPQLTRSGPRVATPRRVQPVASRQPAVAPDSPEALDRRERRREIAAMIGRAVLEVVIIAAVGFGIFLSVHLALH
jgi:predicted anti-sigma-YlaC factor YlaD